MRKIISILAAAVLALGLTACGTSAVKETAQATTAESSQTTQETAAKTENDETEAETSGTETDKTGGVLVVYFSATGNTKDIAGKIAGITGGDLYEIKPAQEYTDADLNWNDSGSRSSKEQNDPSARPEIGSDDLSLDGYKTVYIGYPIWWGEEPRIMDTFAEKYDFNGISMIPFCTSGSSGIGRSGQNLADKAGSGNWLDGKRFAAGTSEDDIRSWIEGLQ